ncbi:MAG: glycoside hydrolase family 28 protein [Lachnospiraceae bacterium]
MAEQQGRQGREPAWCQPLREDLLRMAEELTAEVRGWEEKDYSVTPEQKGYRGGKATEFIQAAVDDAAEHGGGRVILDGGDYLTGTIVLRSDICLEVRKGSRLLGSTDLKDYPEHVAARRTVQDTNMGMNQSLIFAEDCRNIAIRGGGVLDGQGTQQNFPGSETPGATPGRPFLIRILDCSGVQVSGVTLTNPACWTENYLNCENVLLENLIVESQCNYNNDGVDLDGCRNVIVRNCRISSGDDSICFKGASQRETNRVLVENCTCLTSCNAIKIGTDTQGDFRNIFVRNCTAGGVSEEMKHIKHAGADSAFSWEGVDGGTVERVLAQNIRVVRAASPFFIRIDRRGRVKPEDPKPGVSFVRNILMENISGSGNGPRGSYFVGIPERAVSDIVLKNVNLGQKASVKPVTEASQIPPMYGVYPDAHMIDTIGDAPAYGLWARDAERITLLNYKVKPGKGEKRPEYVGVSQE